MIKILTAVTLLLACSTNAQLPARIQNTTLQMPAEAFSSVAYQVENGNLGDIGYAVGLKTPPGETNRLFAIDREGTIRVIPDLANPAPEIFLDISSQVESGFGEEGLLGLAFHPNYASNGYFYVAYTESPGTNTFVHYDTVSRFSVSQTNANRAVPGSELRLIRQADDPWGRNHNGGEVIFGNDGYLYIAAGDGGATWRAQHIDQDLYAGILRIDVDLRPGNPLPNPHPASVGPYAIPHDNPWIGATNFNGSVVNPTEVRTEFYAAGFRNPWRMSVDPVTGDILVGDVGEGSYEEVNLLVRGGNYGWPYREGPEAFEGTPPADVLPFVDPIYAYPRSDGLSVIGGYVYRGTRLPELIGTYLFTDWQNGEIRGLIPDGTNAVPVHLRIPTGVSFGPSAFGVDPRNGDLLMLENAGGEHNAYRLIRNDNSSASQLPPTLQDTGAFSDTANLTPAAGVEPFQINVPFWSDQAVKQRWYSLPDTNLVFGFAENDIWDFPASSVWIKHFDIDMEEGNPATRRRLETRFIVKTTNSLYGVTYRWDSLTNATLVASGGASEDLVRSISGNTVTQRWDYPSRSDCISCHNQSGGAALGFHTAQLNCDALVGAVYTNQLLAMSERNYLSTNLQHTLHWPALSPAGADDVSLTWRIRSYLQANCAHCHNGGAIGKWDARVGTALLEADIINGELNHSGGVPANRVITPGDESLSELLQRIHVRGPGQMPPLASSLVDTQAVALLQAWIAELAHIPVSPTNAPVNIDQVSSAGHAIQLQFIQPSNQAVQVEWAASLASNAVWNTLSTSSNQLQFPSSTQQRTLRDPDGDPLRFYRTRTQTP